MKTLVITAVGGLGRVVAVAFSGCGSTNASPAPTITVTTTVTATPPAPPTTTSTPGYPKVVRIRTLPERMQSEAKSMNPTEAIQLAPGVWVGYPPGASVEETAKAGSLFGWSAAVKAYSAKEGDVRGNSCW